MNLLDKGALPEDVCQELQQKYNDHKYGYQNCFSAHISTIPYERVVTTSITCGCVAF